MSIFYSQSAKPRDFTYQNTKVNAPLELKGTSKRSNAPQDSLRLSTEPTYHATSLNMGPDTRRTINPQYNKENVNRPSSRNLQNSNNYHPGSLMNLFDKTSNDGDRYDRMRKNKAYDVSKESNADQLTKRHLKPVPLKDLYDYKTGISTLPITDQIREEKQTKVVRNYTNAYIKEKYDLTSAISTLPGTFNQRNDSLTTPVSSKKHSEMALKNLINTESSNRKAEVSRRPIEPNTSNRNAISNSTLDQASQINPLSRPKKTSDAREKLYSQSKEEYFGLRDNPQRHKPMGAQNVFKSSIELR